MILSIKYFGAVAQQIQRSSDTSQFDECLTVGALQNQLTEEYNLDQIPFRIAVNQSLTEPDVELKDGDEIALLPPFAGG